jgi:hypothetical protein
MAESLRGFAPDELLFLFEQRRQDSYRSGITYDPKGVSCDCATIT